MSLRQGIHGLVRSRRALILAPVIIVLNSLLVWTLEHTDIVAFATIFVAALVLVSGTFWVTGRATSREIALGEQQSQIVNRLFHPSVGGR
jgi:uncharacterized membrane protein YfcA